MSLRKKYFILAMTFVVLLAGICSYTYLNTPHFSLSPGFYDTEVRLKIWFNPNYQCFYTLDGTIPTKNSTPYTGEILISDASENPNCYSNIRETTVLAFPEVFEQLGLEIPFLPPIPDCKVDKCTIVRAAIYDGDTLISSLSGSYFVGFQNKSLYDDVTVVSLITDPDNLFDYEKGIYVTGQVFDKLRSEGISPDFPYYAWDANYTVSGYEAERPAHIEIWDGKHTSILSENCGIRIQGGASRYLPIKSLSIYAREEYSGRDVFSNRLFGGTIQPHKFVLSSGSNDEKFKLKDFLAHELFADMNFSTYLMKPCVLFLDGEYWGTYYLTETHHDSFISNHYDVPEGDVIIYKILDITEGNESDLELYNKMYDFIANQDMSNPENYSQAKKMIDIDSFIDYYAAEIYIGNQDWPTNNFALWRSRSIKGGSPYRDGRWRWILFDLNFHTCFSTFYTNENILEIVCEYDDLFRSLSKNPEFVSRFVERLRYITYELCVPENYEPIFETYLDTMPNLLNANSIRFWGESLFDIENQSPEWKKYFFPVQDAKKFFETRAGYIETFISHNFPDFA